MQDCMHRFLTAFQCHAKNATRQKKTAHYNAFDQTKMAHAFENERQACVSAGSRLTSPAANRERSGQAAGDGEAGAQPRSRRQRLVGEPTSFDGQAGGP